MRVLSKFEKLTNIIDSIEVYRYDANDERHFSFGTWTSRQHGFIRLGSKEYEGWGENVISVNDKDVNLEEWSSCFAKLKGMTIYEALLYVREHLKEWKERKCEMIEMALVDLAGRVLKQSANQLLELDKMGEVPGVFVILSDDIEEVKKQTEIAVNRKLNSHIKVKLFGDLQLDLDIIKAVRDVVGRVDTNSETYLIGDVNGGYKKRDEDKSLGIISEELITLHEAGLDACEDPAYINNQQWVELQSKVGTLSLIPDYPMRPSREAILKIKEGMGRIYNIHPGCTGSIIDAVTICKKIKDMNAKLMIGDDSLIGPACTAWQQLAIGLAADWVEAIEKDNESETFLKSVDKKVTSRSSGSLIKIDNSDFGFGLLLDTKTLRENAYCYVIL